MRPSQRYRNLDVPGNSDAVAFRCRGRPLCLPFFNVAQGLISAARMEVAPIHFDCALRRGRPLCLSAESTAGHAGHTVHILMPQGSRQPLKSTPGHTGRVSPPSPAGDTRTGTGGAGEAYIFAPSAGDTRTRAGARDAWFCF